MPTVIEVAADFRRRLIAREAETAGRMVREYTVLAERVSVQLSTLTRLIEERRSEGATINVSWLHREERYRELLRVLQIEIAGYTQFAETEITNAQGEAAELGFQQARESVRAARVGTSFVRPPEEALRAVVGNLQQGTPLSELLVSIATDTADRRMAGNNPVRKLPFDMVDAAADAITRSVAQGINPRETALEVRNALGTGLNRALTIARTETLRANRTASIESYKANDDVVRGWTWMAELSSRTCSVCWAKHGTFHELDEEFASHPNCRCTSVPVLVDEENPIVSGEKMLRQRSDEQQREILGPSKYEAWKAGEIELQDLVQDTDHPVWGPGVRERSLADAREAAAERRGEEAKPAPAPAPPKPVDPPAKVATEERDDLSRQLFDGPIQAYSTPEGLIGARQYLRRSITAEEGGRLIAAPAGSIVDVEEIYRGFIVSSRHAEMDITMEREFKVEEGERIVYHAYFRAENAPKGTGIRIFAKQVENYVQEGITRIDVSAAGGPNTPDWNGYYTWARFGYNMEIPARLQDRLKKDGFEADDLHELFILYGKKGADWWKANGTSGHMEFDLTEGSVSRMRLQAYLEENDIRL